VIALGRVMLAAMFLAAIWLDRSQPTQAVTETYGFLIFYLCFALALAAATWTNWWLDARLAVPAHFCDMAFFSVVVLSTAGYTSPFFLIFILPLLSAAIRWGWRETALTALALLLLFLTGGLLVARSETFELQRFIVRAAHLFILSAMLIWFGIHQRFSSLFVRLEDFDSLIGHQDPQELALRIAMGAASAGSGIIMLRSADGSLSGVRIDSDGIGTVQGKQSLVRDPAFGTAMLFDIARDRLFTKSEDLRGHFSRASTVLDMPEVKRLHLTTGLIATFQSGTAQGYLVLECIDDLSGDYVELGRELGRAAGAVLDRSALFFAVAEGAAAQARVTLARDVHDGIVQFIAGATFRVEAIARAARGGADVDKDLGDLKGLLVEEQRDLRGFVTALRREREFKLEESLDELRALAARLGLQWSVKCSVKSNGEQAPIPIRLQLDLEQLLREAVANAVRHGGASKVEVNLAVDGDQLRFDVRDNGSGFAPLNGGSPVEPWSLRERVDRANGSLLLVSRRGRTDISISLPLSGAAA